ncbi:hypothetical protein SAG0014_12540 [Streptococcus agalactiae FSL S3-586]|nr:hypothetical protein SAG0014_12540 [Streptococcus agalactiae FSL S3-586]
MSYIYWFYFIKKNHLFNMLQNVLRPKSIWKFVQSSVVYIGLLVLCPCLFQLAIQYIIYRFNHPDSLVINMVKLVALADALMLLMGSFVVHLMYVIIIPFSKLSKDSSNHINSIE